MIKHGLPRDIIKVERNDGENYIIVICKIGRQTFRFANRYGPKSE